MKKIFATIAVLAIAAGSAFAQVSVGGNYAKTTETTTVTVGSTSTNTTAPLQGFNVGAAYDINIVAGLSVAPGLYYNYATSKDVNSAGLGSIPISGSVDVTRKDHSLSVPVNVKYGFDIVPGTLRIFAFAGPTFQYTLSSKTTTTTTVSVAGSSTSDNKTNDNLSGEGKVFKPFDIAIGGGLGIDIVDMIRVQGGYNYGLMNRSSRDNVTTKQAGWYLGVAFVF